jgi:preprotein translocase subunit SecD
MKGIVGLVIILFFTSCTCPSRKPVPVAVEFRLAETKSAEGLTEVIFEPTGEIFYLHEEVLLSNADIVSAEVIMGGRGPVVCVTMTFSGKEKWARVTGENLQKHLGMLVDGTLVSAPVINAPILEGVAIIGTMFTEEEARRIAEGITVR